MTDVVSNSRVATEPNAVLEGSSLAYNEQWAHKTKWKHITGREPGT